MSAANFITMLALARGLSAAAFGAFTLCYTALLFAGSLQFSLITRPHNVIGATRTGAAYTRYASAIAAGQAAFALMAGLAAAAAALVATASGAVVAPGLLLALAPAIVAWQAQEFVRRVLYTEGRLAAATLNDLISYGGQVAAVVALAALGRLTAPAALYALALTSAAAALVGAWQVRRSVALSLRWEDWRANLSFGSWLAGATVGDWFATQFATVVAAAALGTQAAGAMKACQLLLGPLNVVLSFLDSVLPPRLARAWARGGGAALGGQVRRSYLLSAPVVLGYCLLAALLAGPALRLLYGATYAGATTLAALFALYYAVSYLPRIVSAALQARGHSRPVFLGYVTGGLTAAILTYPAVWLAGANGAVLGMTAAVAAIFAVLVRQERRARAGAVN
ncbi:MAG: oligosaccharide flippase family protein [Dehalococcoidia bacterium]